jgi:uncharacterized repeat protein (TIGR03847 family)
MTSSFDFRQPALVALGSIGPPGQRVFYLQVRQDDDLVTLKLEKQQVAFLAGGLREVLADLAGTTAETGAGPDLEQPVEAEWAVGSLELAYDRSADRIVVVAAEVAAEGEEAGPEEAGPEEAVPEAAVLEEGGGGAGRSGAVARFAITREQAASMIESGRRLLQAGRPPCPLCGFPLTEDHSCPKTNGHRAPAL